MVDAVTFLPAGILAAMGIAIIVLGRALKSEVLAGPLCWCALGITAAAMLLSGATNRRDESSGGRRLPRVAGPQDDRTVANAPPGPRWLADDRLTLAGNWFALAFGALAAASAWDGSPRRGSLRFGCLLLSLAGVALAAAAQDLVVVVVSIALAALPVMALLWAEREGPEGKTAAVQALALCVQSFALLLVGAALVALSNGTTSLDARDALARLASSGQHRVFRVASPIIGDIGCVFLLGGLGIHFLVAPFQFATAEIFEGSKAWGIGLLALFPRGAALFLMVRTLVNGMPRHAATVQTALTSVALLTTLIGCVLAFTQSKIRRLLAFTLALQGGLIFAGLAAGCSERSHPAATPWLDAITPGGIGSAFLCFVFGSLALVGLLAVMGLVEKPGNSMDEASSIAELMRGDVVGTAAACVLLISFAGLPPFAGFWGNVSVLRSILSVPVPAEGGFLPHQNVGYVIIALAAAGAVVAVAAVYMHLVKLVLFDEDAFARETVPATSDVRARRPRTSAGWVAVVAAVAIIIFGAWPEPCFYVAARATRPASMADAASPGLNPAAARAASLSHSRPPFSD